MKLSEVVRQLQLVLPKYTDYFSETISFDSIVVSGGVATISAEDHGLTTGDPILLSNVAIKTPIADYIQSGLFFNIKTSRYHDLTYGYPGYETITLGGFTDPNWNGVFDLIGVPTRDYFQVRTTNSAPVLNGNEYLLEIRVGGVNGNQSVTVVDPDTIQISGDFLDGDYLSGSIKQSVRIAGSINIERTIEEYTNQNVNDLWAFVSMSDAVVSKNRNTQNDATATFANGEDPRLRLIDGFSVFLVGNVTEEIAGVALLDIFRHDMLNPLLKSLSGVKFSSGLATSDVFISILLSHNFVLYNRAILVYQYNFQFVSDITLGDQADESDTRAFTEIDYTQAVDGIHPQDMTFDQILPKTSLTPIVSNLLDTSDNKVEDTELFDITTIDGYG